MSTSVIKGYKQRIEHAARALLFDEQICAVFSQRMTLKVALLKVGFSQDDIKNNKHRHAVDRAKRRLSQASLPSLVDIASPGAFSAITDTDTTATATATTVTVTTAVTKKKRKRKSRRTVPQRTNDECEALKAKNREDESYFQAVEE